MEEKIFRNTRMQLGILISRGVTIKNKRTADFTVRLVFYVLRAQAEYIKNRNFAGIIYQGVGSLNRKTFIYMSL